MKKTSGFTLIELMIVVAIIAIIAAIAIPNLLRSRIQSNESAAIGNLRTITGAQTGYSASNGLYAPTFDLLTDTTSGPAFLLGTWSAPKTGYIFTLASLDADNCYASNADAEIQGRTGIRGFFSDCSGVIRAEPAGPATSTSTPIGE